MGDFIKASKWKLLPKRVAEGVLLHRFIDSTTDDHEISADLRTMLHPVCGKYASIALDMLYDHMLAVEFEKWGSMSLPLYIDQSYKRIESRKEVMPEACQIMVSYMVSQNWLGNYTTIDGIQETLLRMERRIGRNTGFDGVKEAFINEHNRFFEGFHRIFPDLQRKCSQKIISFAR